MDAMTTYANCKPMGEFDLLASFMHEQLMPETDGSDVLRTKTKEKITKTRPLQLEYLPNREVL